MEKYSILFLFLAFSLKNQHHVYCQTPIIMKSVQYSIEGSTFLSNGNVTFWQHANQNGESPTYQYASLWAKSTLRRLYISDSLSKKRFIDWGAGATGILSISKQPSLFLSQLYAQLKIWEIELSVGQRYEQTGLINQYLSSGNYSFSNNALPLPKIQIASLRFVEVPMTKKMLAFKFNYTDGLVGETQAIPFGRYTFIKDTYLHQKSLYGRFGKPHWKLKILGGFCHQVMWGGEYQIWPNNFDLTQKERYWAVVSGDTWQGSRIGNHVANIDLGVSYLFPTFDFMVYRQNLVEDGSLYRGLSNIADGLNGVSISLKSPSNTNIIIEKGIFEILYTYSQGGSVFDFNNGIFGKDNYFNHYIYSNGWSYKGRTLGTPFIMPTSDTREELQKINDKPFTNNNRLFLFHVGLQGKAFDKYAFLTKFSFSKNNGIYDFPFPKNIYQFSGLIEVKTNKKWFNGCELIGSLSVDIGKLLPNQVGVYVGIRKNGYF
jgi:hypothetical protein